MKSTYFLLIGLLALIVMMFFMKNNVDTGKLPIEKHISTSIQLPKEPLIFKKQVFHEKNPDKVGAPKPSKKIISTKQTVLPSPDELWAQQHQNNREFDLPPTIPDMPVISVEQQEAESAIHDDTTPEHHLDDPLTLDHVETIEQPAIESSTVVVPFELQELENTIINNKQQNSIETEEPLIDPNTGLSDKELMQTNDSEATIESDLPVD